MWLLHVSAIRHLQAPYSQTAQNFQQYNIPYDATQMNVQIVLQFTLYNYYIYNNYIKYDELRLMY